jgi:hydrogenase nickel incorporation protein HypA/HybF
VTATLHELSVATRIAEVVGRVMDEHSARKVGEVRVEIGALTCVDPDSLDFCFQAITKGTRLEDARLKILEVKPRAKCRKCAMEYEVRWDDFRCTRCGSTEFEVLIGRDISVKDVEVE